MRGFVLALVAVALVIVSPSARAEDAPKGIFLLTDYPAVAVRPGTTSTVSLRLQNQGLPPERVSLSVSGVPTGWTAPLLGAGQVVSAAMPQSNGSVALQLRLEVPANATGEHTFTISAKGQNTEVAPLQVVVSIAKDSPAKLSLETRLPALRGSIRSSFEYQVAVKNDSGQNLVVSLGAQAPPNFETSFTEAYGAQEISSIPIEAGQSKDVKLRVRPPNTSKAGRYPVMMRVAAEGVSATAQVYLDITGQPQLSMSGRDGILSARASAGIQSPIPIVVTNTGTAPAEEIELSGTGPNGWKIEFQPKTIDGLPPGENREVQALVTPAGTTIAGDYVTSLRVTTRGENATANFRVSVATSSSLGLVAVGIIAVALLILVGAVARFGRR